MDDGRSLAASLKCRREFLDTTHFPDNTPLYLFRDEVCYLILFLSINANCIRIFLKAHIQI